MTSVLISIQPKWCKLIASGKKTVEVRKTRPKLDTPFKCYIYCTKDNSFAEKTLRGFDADGKAIYYKANKGKVIGEFVCDRISPIAMPGYEMVDVVDCEESCLSPKEMLDYAQCKPLYGWHISNLVIYDEPKELSEFRYYNVRAYIDKNGYIMPTHEIIRPPQSWCYVEKGGGSDA